MLNGKMMISLCQLGNLKSGANSHQSCAVDMTQTDAIDVKIKVWHHKPKTIAVHCDIYLSPFHICT